MARVIERQAELAQTRKLPIAASLKAILEAGAEVANVDVVVTSGGQGRKGSGLPRVGSERHDDGNAADLELHRGGKALSFETGERMAFIDFVKACAARGATGIGAGVNYMGDKRIHVGFGSKAVWGAGGISATAPAWLRSAVEAGWAHPVAMKPQRPTLRRGDSGDAVRDLQTALWKVGGYGLLIDSDFGPKTEAAVVAFQSARGLKPDGVVGEKTWGALGA